MFPWRITGAGITFITTFRKELCLILGREKNKTNKIGYDLYEDFGGGIDKGESIKEAAIRECYEETCKTILLDEIIDKKIINMPRYRYGLYFVRLQDNFYSRLNKTFKKNRKELIRLDEDNHYLEIDKLAIIPLSNLTKKSKYKILTKRGYYSKTMRVAEIETFNKEKIILTDRLTQLFYPEKGFDKKLIPFIKNLNITTLRETKDKNITTFID